MKQYFFDLVDDEETFHDFRGREFQSDWDAGQHAKLLAIHLQYNPDSAYADWTVLVRDAPGQVVYALPVPPPDPRCAVAGKSVWFKPNPSAFGELMAAAV
jgi:uncharacterized protein DUF6894